MKILLEIAQEIWKVATAMAPYLLFGFLAAGLLRVFISPEWMRRHMGGRGVMPVVKAVLFGTPLPLCSCGVLAVTASLRQQGAGRAAATGFLLSAPQTGVDSIIATWGMLGPLMAVIRPLLAVLSGIAGGLLVSRYGEQEPPEETRTAGEPCSTESAGKSCCGNTTALNTSDTSESSEWNRPLNRRLLSGLYYGLVTLPADIARPLIAGMLVAGLISALVPPDALAPWIGDGLTAMLVMIAVGIPIYVCATASIPLAISFIHLGASPGAALAFLVAGPATNAATLAVLWTMMGRRTTLLFLLTVVLTALLGGLAYDALAAAVPESFIPEGGHFHHHDETEGDSWVFVALLAICLTASTFERVVRWLLSSRLGVGVASLPVENDPAKKADITLTVTNMTCAHCADNVTRILRETLPDVTPEIDLATRQVVLRHCGPGATAAIERLRAAGFTAEESVR